LKARLDADTIEDRLRGYREALESADIPFDRSLIVECNSAIDAARHAGAGILASEPRPDAVFCTNNFMTLGMMQAITDADLDCPGDIALAGFDDFPWATAFRPRLTAIAQPSYAIGCEAVRLLFDRITGRHHGAPICITVDASLLVRDSCGAKVKGVL
jgi:LacI family transcriptional regulator